MILLIRWIDTSAFDCSMSSKDWTIKLASNIRVFENYHWNFEYMVSVTWLLHKEILHKETSNVEASLTFMMPLLTFKQDDQVDKTDSEEGKDNSLFWSMLMSKQFMNKRIRVVKKK